MKALATTLLLLAFVSNSFGQLANIELSPTTEEEYNYLTKGYRVQLESGLDMKKNYLLEDWGQELLAALWV